MRIQTAAFQGYWGIKLETLCWKSLVLHLAHRKWLKVDSPSIFTSAMETPALHLWNSDSLRIKQNCIRQTFCKMHQTNAKYFYDSKYLGWEIYRILLHESSSPDISAPSRVTCFEVYHGIFKNVLFKLSMTMCVHLASCPEIPLHSQYQGRQGWTCWSFVGGGINQNLGNSHSYLLQLWGVFLGFFVTFNYLSFSTPPSW